MKKYPIRCPVTAYLYVIDGHWKPLLLWHLQTKPLRFKDILSRIPDISTRVLTEQLSEMEEDKLISRRAFNETPPRVEYELTDYGRTLLPGLAMLREWGLQFLRKTNTFSIPIVNGIKKLLSYYKMKITKLALLFCFF